MSAGGESCRMPFPAWAWLRDHKLEDAAFAFFEAGGAPALAQFLVLVGLVTIAEDGGVIVTDEPISRSELREFFRQALA